MEIPNSSRYELLTKISLIVFSFLAVSFVFVYYWLILKNHSNDTTILLNYLIDDIVSENSQFLPENKIRKLSEVLTKTGRPFIITDKDNKPIIWNLSAKKDPEIELNTFINSGLKPVSFRNSYSVRYLYFKSDNILDKMKYYPLFLLGTIALVIFITGYLYYYIKRNEKQSLWIGMSKETAHQLGTPLTSLKGWRDYLSQTNEDDIDIRELEEGISEDIERMSVIVNRFSKISSHQEFKMINIKNIINKSSGYISRRITLDVSRMEVSLDLKDVPDIYANPILIEWTVENLIRNAVESIPLQKKGKINISLFEEKDLIITEISDNGRGIPSKLKHKIFDTGFTTKKRGWGLGLSLAKKVIEQYHKGKLFLKTSDNKGSVFRMELNKYI